MCEPRTSAQSRRERKQTYLWNDTPFSSASPSSKLNLDPAASPAGLFRFLLALGSVTLGLRAAQLEPALTLGLGAAGALPLPLPLEGGGAEVELPVDREEEATCDMVGRSCSWVM